ncbi:hypothetical protein [Kitasatospora sp. NPDC058218]|uniref:hypothetical protein n=1 Tax=Kitasatospora sp. NPDC058218 TaxID=3346385 RepID=UPI0036DBF466
MNTERTTEQAGTAGHATTTVTNSITGQVHGQVVQAGDVTLTQTGGIASVTGSIGTYIANAGPARDH